MSRQSVSGRKLSRRQFLAGAVATSGGALLAACLPPSAAPSATEQPPAPPAPSEIKLTIWHYWGGTREPLLKKALSDFEARTPGVKVEPTIVPTDREQEMVLTAVASNTAPDVLHLFSAELPTYTLNKAIISLDDLLSAAGVSSDEVYESDWKGSQFQSRMWGLPLTPGGANWIVFYATKALKEASLDPANLPKTWADVTAVAKALTKREGDTITRLGVLDGTSNWTWPNVMAGNEATWLSDDLRQVMIDNDAVVEGLQWIVDLRDIQGGQEKIDAFQQAAGESDPFLSGRSAVYYSGVWQYFINKTNAPDLEYVSSVVPNNKGPWHEGNVGGNQWTLPTGTRHVDQAFQLGLWLTRGDGGCTFLTAQLRPSAWKACNEAMPIAKVAPYWPVVQQAVETCRPEHRTPLFNQFMSIWQDMIERAVRHQQTAKEAVTWAAGEMQKANDEFWSKQS